MFPLRKLCCAAAFYPGSPFEVTEVLLEVRMGNSVWFLIPLIMHSPIWESVRACSIASQCKKTCFCQAVWVTRLCAFVSPQLKYLHLLLKQKCLCVGLGLYFDITWYFRVLSSELVLNYSGHLLVVGLCLSFPTQ